MKKLVSETEAEFGPVDILVNNAGVMYYTMMTSKREQEWESQIDVNCKVIGASAVKLWHIFEMTSIQDNIFTCVLGI